VRRRCYCVGRLSCSVFLGWAAGCPWWVSVGACVVHFRLVLVCCILVCSAKAVGTVGGVVGDVAPRRLRAVTVALRGANLTL